MKKIIKISETEYRLIVYINNLLFRFDEYEKHIPVFIFGNKYFALMEEK